MHRRGYINRILSYAATIAVISVTCHIVLWPSADVVSVQRWEERVLRHHCLALRCCACADVTLAATCYSIAPHKLPASIVAKKENAY